MCPHRAIVNLLQPASTQCVVDPVCVPIELADPVCVPIELADPVCVPIELADPVCVPIELADPVCVPIELLSTYFNLPQPNVLLILCVSP